MVDVVFALTGDVRRNSRALRHIRTLVKNGLSVEVLSHGSESGPFELLQTRVHWLNNFTSRGPAFFWQNHRRIANRAISIRARVYHASDLYALPALAAAADRHNGSLTYDARELYPHVASTVGRPWARVVWQEMERRFIRRADGVITVSDGIAAKLEQLYQIDRPLVVHNVPSRSDESSSNLLRDLTGASDDTVIVLHQGQLRKYRGCELLVAAMRQVDNAALVFLGDGPRRLALGQLVDRLGLAGKVFFHDPVPPDQLLNYTASADIGVTMLEDVCLNHHLALPNKLFEYLAANIPVIASDLPEIRKVVVEHEVGITVNPVMPTSIVSALRHATSSLDSRKMWRHNIPSVFSTYNSETSSRRLLQLYCSVLRM
jgi:glycosyltransferase involved in cell wall biosynthesis